MGTNQICFVNQTHELNSTGENEVKYHVQSNFTLSMW